MGKTQNRKAGSESTSTDRADHDEWLIDEALDESFPASDSALHTSPGSTLARRHAAEQRKRH